MSGETIPDRKQRRKDWGGSVSEILKKQPQSQWTRARGRGDGVGR